MTIRAIAIRGPFTDADLAEIIALIRIIDDRNPAGHFELAAVDPEASAMEMAQRIEKALPPRKGRRTDAITIMERPTKIH